MIYKLRNRNKVLKQTEFRQVYLTLVESLISYGIIGWAGAFDNAISQLQVVKIEFLEYCLITNEYTQRKMYLKN